MDWANDQLGKLINASERSLFGYGFTCPTCGEPVRRRAGLERRPHFAHYSHSAKPDCENYHPSIYERSIAPGRVWQEPLVSLERISLRGGVFLERTEGGRFSLILKLPRLRSDTDICGEVQVRSALGVRTYAGSQLRRPQFLPVAPEVPLVEVFASDQLVDAVAAIEEDISSFRVSDNVFRGSSEGGRLLSPGEDLEWGESYRICTQQQLAPAPAELKCERVAGGGTRGWFLYEVELPSATDGNTRAREVIARYLGRTVKRPSPRVYSVDPLPHHIDLDGTYVYSFPPGRILLRRTGDCEVSVEGSARTEATLVQDNGAEWIEVRNLSVGEFSVRVEGNIRFAARIEDCELFCPRGVQLMIGDASWEIFESGLRDELRNRQIENLLIQCPTARIAEGVHLVKDQWIQRGAFYSLRKSVVCPQVDANNFGALTWIEDRPDDTSQKFVDANIAAQRLWVEGLVARAVGGGALPRLSGFSREGHPAIFPTAYARRGPWLYPYLRLARYDSESGTR